MEWIVRQPAYRLALQILLWAGMWLLLPLLSGESYNDELWVWRRWGMLAFGAAILVLVNIWVLIPHLYQKRRFLLYLFVGLVSVILVKMGTEWLSTELGWNNFRRGPRRGPDPKEGLFSMRQVFGMIPYAVAFLGSAFVEITFFTISSEKERAQIRSEKLESEMKWLKWQTNPHFLFNALHNIYALSVMKSDKAPDHLLRLSEMLRYMLYECNEERVPLENEIEYLHNYIALQQLKDSQGLNIELQINGEVKGKQMAPMLLLPFVENAFKHSHIENREHGWIRMDLSVDHSDLSFTVRNSLPQKKYTKDEYGGIGHKNVVRMLDLAYPDKHQLSIAEGDDYFEVNLKLRLS